MSSFSATAIRKLRLHLRDREMRAVRRLRDEAAAVERAHRTDAVRHRRRRAHHDRAAHAVAGRADLLALVDFRPAVEPRDERLRVGRVRGRTQRLRERRSRPESASAHRSARSAPSSCDRTDSRRARCNPTPPGACPSAGTRGAARRCRATRARPRVRPWSAQRSTRRTRRPRVLIVTSLSLTSTAFAARGSMNATPTAAASTPMSRRVYFFRSSSK